MLSRADLKTLACSFFSEQGHTYENIWAWILDMKNIRWKREFKKHKINFICLSKKQAFLSIIFLKNYLNINNYLSINNIKCKLKLKIIKHFNINFILCIQIWTKWHNKELERNLLDNSLYIHKKDSK